MVTWIDSAVARWLSDPFAGFAVGTFGAIAEFLHRPGAQVAVEYRRRDPAGVHLATCNEGALRVDLGGALAPFLSAHAWRRPTGNSDWTHAVAICLPTEVAAGPSRESVTVLGPIPTRSSARAPWSISVSGLPISKHASGLRTPA